MAMKRPATAAAGAPAKVLKSVPGLDKKVQLVKEAITAAEHLPEGVKEMLAAGAFATMKTPKDKRHPFQLKIIGWYQEALETVGSKLRTRVEEGDSLLAGANTEKERRQTAQQTAEEQHEASVTDATAKKDAFANTQVALQNAEAALVEAQAAQKTGDADLNNTAEEKSKLEESLTSVFEPLKAGGVSTTEKAELLEAAAAIAKVLSLDASMQTSLPSAFAKEPSERGSFDQLVVTELGSEIEKRIASYAETLASGEPGKQERAAKVDAAQSELDAAKKALEEAEQAQTDAATALTDAATAAKEAAKAVKSYNTDMKNAALQLATSKKELAAFEKGPAAAFKELLEFDGTVKTSTKYKYIDRVRYEKELLELADANEVIGLAVAEKLWTDAMDGPGVTPTEKRTLKYIMKTKPVADDAKTFLSTKLGASWYQTIDGVQYERALLTIAADVAKPIDAESAEKLWESGQDGGAVTACEKVTFEYILANYEFVPEAKADLEAKVAALVVEE